MLSSYEIKLCTKYLRLHFISLVKLVRIFGLEKFLPVIYSGATSKIRLNPLFVFLPSSDCRDALVGDLQVSGGEVCSV